MNHSTKHQALSPLERDLWDLALRDLHQRAPFRGKATIVGLDVTPFPESQSHRIDIQVRCLGKYGHVAFIVTDETFALEGADRPRTQAIIRKAMKSLEVRVDQAGRGA